MKLPKTLSSFKRKERMDYEEDNDDYVDAMRGSLSKIKSLKISSEIMDINCKRIDAFALLHSRGKVKISGRIHRHFSFSNFC